MSNLKGMTPEQYLEIMQMVQKHHRFGMVQKEDRITEHSFHIKYIDSVYDSRTGDIWSVSFRGLGRDISFSTNMFVMEVRQPDDFPYNNLYDFIKAYLKGEFIPTEEYFKK
jgi:hypothetical protein